MVDKMEVPHTLTLTLTLTPTQGTQESSNKGGSGSFLGKDVRWQSSNRRPDASFGQNHVLDELGAAHLPQNTMVGTWLALLYSQVKSNSNHCVRTYLWVYGK